MVDIIYADPKYFRSFHAALSSVALEKIYIEMIESPPYEKTADFQGELVKNNLPGYYAICDDRVVGWCDVFPVKNPRQSHRGFMGMGIIDGYRGQGIGARLLQAVIDHCKRIGLEKIDLQVYTTNKPAIALYKKFGFEEEGLIRKYRKLEGTYYDAVWMGKLLG